MSKREEPDYHGDGCFRPAVPRVDIRVALYCRELSQSQGVGRTHIEQ